MTRLPTLNACRVQLLVAHRGHRPGSAIGRSIDRDARLRARQPAKRSAATAQPGRWSRRRSSDEPPRHRWMRSPARFGPHIDGTFFRCPHLVGQVLRSTRAHRSLGCYSAEQDPRDGTSAYRSWGTCFPVARSTPFSQSRPKAYPTCMTQSFRYSVIRVISRAFKTPLCAITFLDISRSDRRVRTQS